MASENERLIKMGLTIAYHRKQKNWTQEQLAEKAHLSRNLIGHIEAPDMIKSCRLTTLFKIADALEIPPYKLLLDFDEESGKTGSA